MSDRKKQRTSQVDNEDSSVQSPPPNLVGKQTSKQHLAVRPYLDQTVVPVLLQGLTALVKARPEDEDPIVWLANWLLERQKKKEEGGNLNDSNTDGNDNANNNNVHSQQSDSPAKSESPEPGE